MIWLNDEFIPPQGDGPPGEEISKLAAMLETGKPAERQRALSRLIELKAERQLTDCLQSSEAPTVQLATTGLWECWLNEKGQQARQAIDEGIELMNAGHFTAAGEIFRSLMKQYPDWAEAINKQATLLYLSGKPEESIELCVRVVALKPAHFGAWNGMALCAVQMQDWRTALFAARKARQLLPSAEANLEIIRLARAKLGDGEEV